MLYFIILWKPSCRFIPSAETLYFALCQNSICHHAQTLANIQKLFCAHQPTPQVVSFYTHVLCGHNHFPTTALAQWSVFDHHDLILPTALLSIILLSVVSLCRNVKKGTHELYLVYKTHLHRKVCPCMPCRRKQKQHSMSVSRMDVLAETILEINTKITNTNTLLKIILFLFFRRSAVICCSICCIRCVCLWLSRG